MGSIHRPVPQLPTRQQSKAFVQGKHSDTLLRNHSLIISNNSKGSIPLSITVFGTAICSFRSLETEFGALSHLSWVVSYKKHYHGESV